MDLTFTKIAKYLSFLFSTSSFLLPLMLRIFFQNPDNILQLPLVLVNLRQVYCNSQQYKFVNHDCLSGNRTDEAELVKAQRKIENGSKLKIHDLRPQANFRQIPTYGAGTETLERKHWVPKRAVPKVLENSAGKGTHPFTQ